MGVTGIDIAWDRPTIAQIKATGAQWVGRYFSTDPSKNLTAAEVRDYHAAGLGIVTVWETTTGRATQGYQAGIDDANLAEGQRKAVGLPGDHVHHFAVDMDTDWASVEPYFQGVEAVIGKARTGCYGGRRVIEGAHAAGIKYLWQTVAWSGGVWLPYATIRQPFGTTLGGAADYDTAEVVDFGQYPRPTSEVDMPLTDADGELVATHLLNKTLPSPFRKDAKGQPLQISVAQYFEYLDKHYDDEMNMFASVKAQNEQLKSAVASLAGAVAKIASGGVDPAVVAADVLHELSAALGAAAAPAKP